MDDKITITLCVTAIVIVAMCLIPNSENVVNSALTGLFGIAVGKNLK